MGLGSSTNHAPPERGKHAKRTARRLKGEEGWSLPPHISFHMSHVVCNGGPGHGLRNRAP